MRFTRCWNGGLNTLLGRPVDRFSTGVSIVMVIAHLQNGRDVVLSGEFRLKNRNLHHIVSLAGFLTDRNEDVTHFIFNDPYGDFRNYYQDQHGNNIRITRDEFVVIFKPTGNDEIKWAHLVTV